MWLKELLIFMTSWIIARGKVLQYDTYTGAAISTKDYMLRVKQNTAEYCTIEVEECDPDAWRRVDNTCNNLEHPTRGGRYTPFYSFLPPDFSNVDLPRKAKSGRELPPFRKVKTSTLSVGSSLDGIFTALVPIFWQFMFSDVMSPDDILNYVLADPPCCSDDKKRNKLCLAIDIPNDDPILRFSSIRCQNQTIPTTFQSANCLGRDTSPVKVDTVTPHVDLSGVYGSSMEALYVRGRLFRGGLLRYDEPKEKGGQIWPPSSKVSKDNACFANELPLETRCHDVPDRKQNTFLGQNLGMIWYWRQHNRLADELLKLNPCWDDEKLFNTARDINIALLQQVYLYEFLPALLGPDNMIKDGVITSDQTFRDLYNETEEPSLCTECIYAQRWMNTLQNGMLNLYNKNGTYTGEFPIVDTIARTGILEIDDFIGQVTQGLFREPCGKVDHEVDYDLSDRALPNQIMSDAFTSDLVQNRYLGFQPYIKYVDRCTGRNHTTFEDLFDVMDSERTYQLQTIYENVEDVDLMAGLSLERSVPGGFVPMTLYCLLVEQLKKNIRTDRHWYERQTRPHAFTAAQLREIRKASIARVLCNVGEITHIQPYPFLLPGPENEIDDCNKTTQNIHMSVFEDPTCKETTT